MPFWKPFYIGKNKCWFKSHDYVLYPFAGFWYCRESNLLHQSACWNSVTYFSVVPVSKIMLVIAESRLILLVNLAFLNPDRQGKPCSPDQWIGSPSRAPMNLTRTSGMETAGWMDFPGKCCQHCLSLQMSFVFQSIESCLATSPLSYDCLQQSSENIRPYSVLIGCKPILWVMKAHTKAEGGIYTMEKAKMWLLIKFWSPFFARRGRPFI